MANFDLWETTDRNLPELFGEDVPDFLLRFFVRSELEDLSPEFSSSDEYSTKQSTPWNNDSINHAIFIHGRP